MPSIVTIILAKSVVTPPKNITDFSQLLQSDLFGVPISDLLQAQVKLGYQVRSRTEEPGEDTSRRARRAKASPSWSWMLGPMGHREVETLHIRRVGCGPHRRAVLAAQTGGLPKTRAF